MNASYNAISIANSTGPIIWLICSACSDVCRLSYPEKSTQKPKPCLPGSRMFGLTRLLISRHKAKFEDDVLYEHVKAFVVHGAADSDTPASCK